ncbi:gypsy/ty3 retroelement polyprotein [Tanacetum coccineum]|uniref:Gypsy/ty3 retroelement polyprotein n=1 Tax=Tanacetum coccineum TaxID=301880 RepID=A0ABQ5GUH1_9ASTR
MNNMQFSMVTKIEFLKFRGDDVMGWLFKCEQFFKVDNIVDDHKVNLISIHLHDIALMWHRQFVRIMGENLGWAMYRQVILQRFGLAYDDPLAEIKKIKHVKSVQDYIDEYDKLLRRVELSEEKIISFFMAGLKNDVEVAMRMFNQRSLAELYGLAKLQEANLNALREKNKTPLLPTPIFTQSNSPYTNSPKPMQLPAPNSDVFIGSFASNEEIEAKWEEEQEDRDCQLTDVINMLGSEEETTPHISLNALIGRSIQSTPTVLNPLLEEYADVFAIPKELPPFRSHDHKIPLKEGTPPINIKPYRHPPIIKDAIESMVQELLESGVIRHNQSSFSYLVVMVNKKDGSC